MTTDIATDKIPTQLWHRLEKYLAIRPRSVAEIETYLSVRKRQSPEVVALVVEKLKAQGALNDHQFANWYLNDRMAYTSYGISRIRLELVKKGVSKEVLADVFADQDGDELAEMQVQKLDREIEKFAARNQSLEPMKYKQRLYRRLLSRGFSYDEIGKAIKNKDKDLANNSGV